VPQLVDLNEAPTPSAMTEMPAPRLQSHRPPYLVPGSSGRAVAVAASYAYRGKPSPRRFVGVKIAFRTADLHGVTSPQIVERQRIHLGESPALSAARETARSMYLDEAQNLAARLGLDLKFAPDAPSHCYLVAKSKPAHKPMIMVAGGYGVMSRHDATNLARELSQTLLLESDGDLPTYRFVEAEQADMDAAADVLQIRLTGLDGTDLGVMPFPQAADLARNINGQLYDHGKQTAPRQFSIVPKGGQLPKRTKEPWTKDHYLGLAMLVAVAAAVLGFIVWAFMSSSSSNGPTATTPPSCTAANGLYDQMIAEGENNITGTELATWLPLQDDCLKAGGHPEGAGTTP
jgi:hypothetical protein